MLNAIIEHENKVLHLEFPCKRRLMAEHLASIGVRTPAHDIKCVDNASAPIKVKIYGNSEFEGKLASFIAEDNTLSSVNSFCEMYHNMPYANKIDIMDSVMRDEISSLREFGLLMMQRRMQDTTAHYYCPLVATVYYHNEYGGVTDYPDEVDGNFLAQYEEDIRDMIDHENSLCGANIAEYFDGSNSTVAKLKEIHFSTQNVEGVLYGCIRVELTEPLTPEEDAEIKEYLIGQCSDGYGEGLEQRPICISDGELFVSYWNYDETYFMLNSDEFDNYLCDMKMGEIR